MNKLWQTFSHEDVVNCKKFRQCAKNVQKNKLKVSMKMKKRDILSIILSEFIVLGGFAAFVKSKNKKIIELNQKFERSDSYYKITNQWISNIQRGLSLEHYFLNNGINTIAIYGRGSLGEILYNELKNSHVKVLYFIDQTAHNGEMYDEHCNVISLQDLSHENVPQAIVVTPIHVYNEIENNLSKVYNGTIISLDEAVYSL